MSKILIEQALRRGIEVNELHRVTLMNGITRQRENSFTNAMVPYITYLFSQVRVYNNKLIDLVKIELSKKKKITKEMLHQVEWALEAKHYSPHQANYIPLSLEGPTKDVLKLTDCGFSKFYILQLQTEVVDFTINTGSTYAQFLVEFPFMKYLSKATKAQAIANIANVGVAPNSRIDALIAASRIRLDANLIYNNIEKVVEGINGKVKVKIHYLISGPFNSEDIRNRLYAAGYNNVQPLYDQYNAMPDINVSIQSDVNA